MKMTGGPVVPHEGTWIEIHNRTEENRSESVVPHEGTWIEIWSRYIHTMPADRRSPRGNVDWNKKRLVVTERSGYVVPHEGTWIEIEKTERSIHTARGRSPRGNVDWNVWVVLIVHDRHGRSPRGNVDWNKDWRRKDTNRAKSFPTRERGLKCHVSWPDGERWLSFPTRERGLKFMVTGHICQCTSRSPRGNVDWNLLWWPEIF